MTRISENRIAASKPKSPNGLQSHFRGEFGIEAKLEKAARPRPHRAVFRQIAAGLPHQPYRRYRLSVAGQDSQQRLVHERGRFGRHGGVAFQHEPLGRSDINSSAGCLRDGRLSIFIYTIECKLILSVAVRDHAAAQKRFVAKCTKSRDSALKLAAIVILALLLVALIGCGFWLWTPDKSPDRSGGQLLEWARRYRRDLRHAICMCATVGQKTLQRSSWCTAFGSSLHTWEPWAAALQNDYRVVRFDLPGSGLSEPDTTGDYTDSRSMALLEALMDRLGIDQASLIGNSIGGRIAWKFAARYPQRVTKLVLVSPDGFASAGFAYGQKPSVPATIKLMRYILPKALLRTNLEAAYGDPTALTDETVDRYYDLMLGSGHSRRHDRADGADRAGRPGAAAAEHPRAHAAGLGREGRADPVQQCRRLSPQYAGRQACLVSGSGTRTAGRGAYLFTGARPIISCTMMRADP